MLTGKDGTTLKLGHDWAAEHQKQLGLLGHSALWILHTFSLVNGGSWTLYRSNVLEVHIQRERQVGIYNVLLVCSIGWGTYNGSFSFKRSEKGINSPFLEVYQCHIVKQMHGWSSLKKYNLPCAPGFYPWQNISNILFMMAAFNIQQQSQLTKICWMSQVEFQMFSFLECWSWWIRSLCRIQFNSHELA